MDSMQSYKIAMKFFTEREKTRSVIAARCLNGICHAYTPTETTMLTTIHRNTSLETWESNVEIPAQHSIKNSKNRQIEEGRTISFTLPALSQCQEKTLGPQFLPISSQGKNESGVSTQPFQTHKILSKGSLHPCPTQVTEGNIMTE